MNERHLRFKMHLAKDAMIIIALVLFAWMNPIAHASPNSGITYHGRIVSPDGTPLQGASVQFQMQIRSAGNEDCLLYQEVQTINMAASNGVFSITINDGTGTRTDTGSYSFDQVLSNRSPMTFAPGVCASGVTYTPNNADGRVFQVSFRDENMSAYEPLPNQALNFAPMAIQAKYIGGFSPTNLLRFDDTAALSNTTVLNATQLGSLIALINGTSSLYMQGSMTSGAPLPVISGTPASPSTGSVWFNSATGQVQYYNGTTTQTLGSGSGSGTVTSIAAGTGLTGGTIRTAGTIALATSGVTASTYKSVTVDTYGRVTAGSNPTTLSGYGITDGGTVTSVSLTAPTIFSVSGSPLTTSGTLAVSLASETAHQAFLAPAGSNGTPTFRNINISDLMSSISGTFLTGSSCTSGQALTYSTITDTIACATIPLSSSQVTTALGYTPVQNVGGGLSIQEGVASSRPSAGNAGALYVATDTKVIFRDNGGAWDQISNGAASIASLTDASATDESNSNIMLGTTAGSAMTVGTAKRNIGIGYGALAADTTQVDNVAIGANAMGSAASPSNVGIGTNALASVNNSIGQNTAVGYQALGSSSNTGYANTALGYFAGGFNSSGAGNTAIGNSALGEMTSGSFNTAVGASAGGSTFNSTGSDNTLIGYGAGTLMSTGTDNTLIGYEAGQLLKTGSNNILIGSGVAALTNSTSNSLNIGNAIYGNLSTPAIGIGIPSPQSALDVAGSVKVGTDTTTCSSTIQGAIHLNGTALEYCNGTAWTLLGGGGGGYSSSGGTISGNVIITPTSGTGLTVTSGGETISAGGLSVTGGVNANSGNITAVGASITGAGAMTVAAGGTNQNLGLNSSGTGSINLGTGNGTGLSVLDVGASTVDYITIKGSAAGGIPQIGTAGSDTNISLNFSPKGTGNSIFANGSVGIGGAPSYNLDVTGTINASGAVRIGGTSTHVYLTSTSASDGMMSVSAMGAYHGGQYSTNGAYSSSGSFYNGSAWYAQQGTAGIVEASANGVQIFTDSGLTPTTTYSPTERLRITNAGNIGVGTSAPSALLEVDGTALFNSAGTEGTSQFLASNMTSTQTTLTVSSTTGFPPTGTVWVDKEAMSYTGLTSTQFTGLTRGVYTTGAGTHLTNAVVHVTTFNVLNGSVSLMNLFQDGGFQTATAFAQGELSVAMGQGSQAQGNNSIAIGDVNYASGFAASAFGSYSQATGDYSSTIGSQLEAPAEGETTVGSANAVLGTETAGTWVLTDPIFRVGNGPDTSHRSTALTVLKNGNTGLGTMVPGATLDVNGHIADSASAPVVLSSCGTSPSVVGNDTRGVITVGSGGITTCAVAFASAYSVIPVCVMSGPTVPTTAKAYAMSTSKTGFTLTFSASVTSAVISYICMQ